MHTQKARSMLLKIAVVTAALLILLVAVFLLGRYGWKLLGFRVCDSAGITDVSVESDGVHITGFYPGSFPQGFCGYVAEEQGEILFVGFRFSGLFGSFETGDFSVTIPVTGKIREVKMVTRQDEISLWNSRTGFFIQAEHYGVYVKPDRSDVCFIEMECEAFSGGVRNGDFSILERGEYLYVDNDIMAVSMEAGAPVPFTITARDPEGTVIATGSFSFDASMEKLYLTLTPEGEFVVDP